MTPAQVRLVNLRAVYQDFERSETGMVAGFLLDDESSWERSLDGTLQREVMRSVNELAARSVNASSGATDAHVRVNLGLMPSSRLTHNFSVEVIAEPRVEGERFKPIACIGEIRAHQGDDLDDVTSKVVNLVTGFALQEQLNITDEAQTAAKAALSEALKLGEKQSRLKKILGAISLLVSVVIIVATIAR